MFKMTLMVALWIMLNMAKLPKRGDCKGRTD